MRVLLLILLIFLQGSFGAEDETKTVVRSQSVTLTCPIDAKNCGELHSIKWFKGTERIAVSSGDGKFSHVEGSIADRLSVEYAPNKIGSRLNIKAIQIEDEDVYMCEITYLEPLESCETTGEYSIDVKVTVPPSAILLLNNNHETISNNTKIGPLREGHKLDIVCEVRGARPQPVVGWYRAGKKLADSEEIDELNGLYTVKSNLSLELSRQELGASIECRVENAISNFIHIDLQVRPTRIELIGVKLHAIEGAKVLLECHVYGGRPAANISWFNGTTMITNESKLATIIPKPESNDDPFKTVSQMYFTATRFENGAEIRCEADNIVMRDGLEKPLHGTHLLEVMYPPVISVKPENITINENENFLLFCDYDANPASILSVRWLQNGGVINVNQPRFDGGNSEQTALVVKNASRHDIGSYSCELYNEVGIGMSENQVVVDIQYKPIVTIRLDPPSPIIEDHNTNVTLYCDVQSGNPSKLLKVQWMVNGELLKELPECVTLPEDEMSEDATNFCTVDPTKMLLQNVNQQFLGNYSCRGYNAAGWGDESESEFLDVYYEPGNATISHFPLIPVKTKSMVLSCAVDDAGNPKSTRFRWLRGEKPVVDIVTSQWTIDPVGLDSRNNFSCFAFNEGGNGSVATINIDIQVAPWFINKLPPYTGFLYSEPAINLTCRVECVPSCSIYWFKDGEEISSTNDRYTIREVLLPADTSTGDFESVLSELHFNMMNWETQKLDVLKDSANYTCSSSNNSVGLGVRSATYFAVEFPPENVTVSHTEVFVNEGSIPARVLCSAKGLPEPNFHWKRFEANEPLAKGNALIVNKALYRSDKGIYSCVAENKHGSSSVNILMNILYTPNCTITRTDIDDKDTLSCVADGNPEVYDYVWDFKSENETGDDNLEFKKNNRKSFLVLSDDVHQKRVYRCRANNTVGVGMFCEIPVEGHQMWWSQSEMMTLCIIAAVILACLIAVIILIIIIICMCRRRRKRSSKSMEKSLVENKPTDPNAEPNENYENLPFHGMQNPPTKFNYLTAPANNINVNLVHQQKHQQKPLFSHPYSDYFDSVSSQNRSLHNNNNNSINCSTPNNSSSTIRSVKNYRKPHPPIAAMPTSINYNTATAVMACASYTPPTASTPMTNNLNHSFNSNSYKYTHNNSNNNNSNINNSINTNNNSSNNNNNSNKNNNIHSQTSYNLNHSNHSLSRRGSQSSSASHCTDQWNRTDKSPHTLSLCINRINLKKSNKSSSSSSSTATTTTTAGGGGSGGGNGGGQFQSMRCRKHRNRNHFFNNSNNSYQKYQLTKSCSNDTMNDGENPNPVNVVQNPQTTYKFI